MPVVMTNTVPTIVHKSIRIKSVPASVDPSEDMANTVELAVVVIVAVRVVVEETGIRSQNQAGGASLVNEGALLEVKSSKFSDV